MLISPASATRAFGPLKPEMICPHCGVKGEVHAKSMQVKTGISGGKAVAGLLTGGLSLLAVGLSQKQRMTEAFCNHCSSRWKF